MLKKGKITIKDIAKSLNISVSTVSRALKDHPDISEETKKKVQAFAEKYNYSPNPLALSLRNSRTDIIGVMVPQISHFFFSSVIEGVESVAEEHGFHVFLSQSGESEIKEKHNVQAFIKGRVAGVLVSMAKETTDFEHFKLLQENEIATVFFDRICPDINTHRVVVDDYQGARTAVSHLIDNGCKRIAMLHSPMNLEISKNRFNGYKDALRKAQIDYDESLVRLCDNRLEALRVVPELMNIENPPDAFFAVNDRTASGVLQVLKSLNISIPEDVAVCGFSNGLISEVTDPPLTTVEQNGFEMGVAAAKLLFNIIANPNQQGEYRNKVIKTKLLVRGSTQRNKLE